MRAACELGAKCALRSESTRQKNVVGGAVVVKSYPITGLDRSIRPHKVKAHRIFRQSVHEGGNVVSPTHRPPLPPRENSWYLFLLEAESILGS